MNLFFIAICSLLLFILLTIYWSTAIYITFNQITSSQKKDIENYVSLLSKKEKPLKCRKNILIIIAIYMLKI